MAIRIVRLTAGEELLADIQEPLDAQTIKLENPVLIAAMPNPKTGNVDVQLQPFAPLAAEKFVVVSMSQVVCVYEPVVGIINKYNTMFGSGLILPNTGVGSPGIV